MSEGTELADLILPDATYLERWAAEAPQSYSFTKFIQIRQPVTKPLGEALSFQDIAIQLARRIGGNMVKLFPYDTAEDYLKEACAMSASGALGVDGEPLKGDLFEYICKYGFIYQSTKPSFNSHEKEVAYDPKKHVIDKETNTIWDPHKAHVSDEDVKAKGYRGSKYAYKGYVGQMVAGKALKGFKPDKVNKSGLMEFRTPFLAKSQAQLLNDMKPFMARPEFAYLDAHIKSNMPTYLPVPEHQMMQGDEMIMISFKVNVQIHSRSQNCKWLSELYHDNPAWINPATAAKLGIKNGDKIRISYVDKQYKGRLYEAPTQTSIETKARVTEGIHPEVVGVSFHCGHWAYGEYASGKKAFGQRPEKDLELKWWKETGTHPNWIIPNAPDPVSGQWRSNDTVVTVAKA